MEFTYEVKILEGHLDSFGHVNNATYLELYEEARWQFITDNGYGLKEIHENKKGPVILDVHVRFQKEIHVRETITIKSRTQKYDGRVGKIDQEMIKANGDVASTATFTVGFFDLVERKLIRPTPEWQKAIGMKA